MSFLPIFLIGGAGPPAPREFASLIAALEPSRPIVPLDMVVFHGGPPAPDFTMTTETDAVLRAMGEARAERGHMLGYSGGAAVALAFACAYPDRVASLTLEELAWVGAEGATPSEERFWAELTAAMALGPYDALIGFRDLMVLPEVRASLPLVGAEAPWIGSLVDGVRASIGAFARAEVDWAALQESPFPIYAVVGSLSNPVFELRSRRLAERVGRTTVKVFAGLHHVVPPHRAATDELASELEDMWRKAE
jgi:pimeloyl-ACP methyl ester carboxylesterase